MTSTWLSGRLVRLRPMEPDEVESLWRWNQDPEVMRWLTARYPESLAQAQARAAARPVNSYSFLLLGIEVIADGALVGVAMLVDGNPETGRAELNIYLGERDRWNSGYGTEAARLLCRYGFDQMRLHAVSLSVVAENEAARHVYRRLGFVEEGRIRDGFRRDGRWHDMILMGMLEGELRDEEPAGDVDG
ncbi:RimJ/RimL family protein N-acetyltransferase [Actinoalloteichus hoggarensis]|uniref:Spermidine N(1)-acetyltransferase n=1 Tax=Actinoalloteichus hoggarensis TaxID=1470176 RepID=A0A221W6B9_9PSEU|nr:Spermidine N(1)-acetyltransferase [Actinoalloteichus hoggarensis]MBB5922061.1 RimJ/RimL family protein N-acetyltransferase [Actinoalloteichus hoggarensis]